MLWVCEIMDIYEKPHLFQMFLKLLTDRDEIINLSIVKVINQYAFTFSMAH